MARQIVVDIVGDAKKFNSATTDAVSNANKLDHGLRNSAVGGAVAGVAMAGVNKAIDFVTDALSGASEAAKEDTASSDRLALAYKNTAKAQELSVDQIEAVIAANQAKGVSDSAQRDGISDFLDLTGSATEAMKLNNATVELAAAKGIDYASAEAMIRSAAAGKTAALAKAGVAIEKGASVTEIATKVNQKFGGSLDANAKTQSGKAAIASEKMGEAMEKVGKIVNKVAEVAMPAIADAMSWVIDNVIPPLTKAFEWLAKNVFPAVSRAVQIMAPIVTGVFKVLTTIIGKWLDVVGTIIGVVSHVFGKVGDIVRGVSGVFSKAFGAISGIVRGAFNVVIDIINGVIRAINGIQVHIHVGPVGYDFNGLNLGYLPRLHSGGIVPGVEGQEVLTILQAGERVSSRSDSGGAAIVINVYGDTYGDGIDALADKLALRLRLAGA